MSSNVILKSAVALAAICSLLGGSAQAATHTLNLTGVAGNGFFHPPFTIGSTTFNQWSLGLSGLDSMNTLLVTQGDIINFTITLDELFTIPGSVTLTDFGLSLGGDGFPAGDTETANNVFEFYDGMSLVKSGASSFVSSTGQIPSGVIFFAPDNGPVTFDKVSGSFTISTLSAPATLDYSVISYTLFSTAAVPEPSAWAMMIIGFGGVGALMRRRRNDSGLAAFG